MLFRWAKLVCIYIRKSNAKKVSLAPVAREEQKKIILCLERTGSGACHVLVTCVWPLAGLSESDRHLSPNAAGAGIVWRAMGVLLLCPMVQRYILSVSVRLCMGVDSQSSC